jgi:hypothetical protein
LYTAKKVSPLIDVIFKVSFTGALSIPASKRLKEIGKFIANHTEQGWNRKPK